MKKLEFKGKTIEYHVFDPTGNITALVETAVDPAEQPQTASEIMKVEPAVEQVGFVTFADGEDSEVPVSLRMAGGEFCGNATMCAAALYLLKNEADKNGSGSAIGSEPTTADPAAARTVWVSVSGTAAPLEVTLTRTGDVAFGSSVTMPPALGIDELRLANGMLSGSSSLDLPIVRLEGIAHVIIEPDSGFFGLKEDPALAETLLRGWCGVLNAECLGMMFLGDESGTCSDQERKTGAVVRQLTPLVYVPGADTMFWENSCASGSAAAGIWLAAQAGTPIDVTFDEPAGRFRVESDPLAKKTVLHGLVTLSS